MMVVQNGTQRAGLFAGWELEFRLPEPLLIENILMKLITKVQECLSSPELMTSFAIS